MSAPVAAGRGVATAAEAKADRHVHEIDIVRILTFACVIGVHTTSAVNVASNPVSNGLEMLLHFTRESFFFITGFVLMHQYGSRRYDVGRFYRRRLLLVGGPYLAWSLIYAAWRPVVEPVSWTHQLTSLPYQLLIGSAWYHLYFLLVSLQIYLLFPLISRLVNATRRHHLALLTISAVLQLAWLAELAYAPSFHGWAARMDAHEDIYVWNYQFWILLGAVTACHRHRVLGWVARHRAVIVALVLAGTALALGWYCAGMLAGKDPITASTVLQPVMVPWSMAAVAGLVAIGTSWRERRRPGRLQAAVNWASDRSFGIYLVHPLLLSMLLGAAHHTVQRHVANPQLTVLVYAFVVLAAVGVTEVLRRVPGSLILTGRPKVAPRRPPTSEETLAPTTTTESVTPIG